MAKQGEKGKIVSTMPQGSGARVLATSSVCEALENERGSLRTIMKEDANEDFVVEVLNSVKDEEVVNGVVAMWIGHVSLVNDCLRLLLQGNQFNHSY